MELRYCEECGDVIHLNSDEPPSLHDHFVCPRCEGGKAPATQAESPRTGAEDFSAEDLDLFSAGSIAQRKQDFNPGARKAPEARLRLVKTNKTPAGAKHHTESTFPTDRLMAAPIAAAPRAGARGKPAARETSGTLAKSARKIIFRCLYCKSPISIRPVEKTSKLVCPSCGEAVYVTPTGRLLKKNPSHAVRKEAAADGAPSAGATHDAISEEAAETIERLSAFEEHGYSQDPDKTAFLTEESSPLPQLADGEDFPLANELLSTVVRARENWLQEEAEDTAEDEEEWPQEEEDEEEDEQADEEDQQADEEDEDDEDDDGYEEEEIEEWPGESDLLAEDEFDENLSGGSRKRSGRRRPSTARVLLVGLGLLLPFALAIGLLMTHFSQPESRSWDPDPALTTLEKLGGAAQKGIIKVFGNDEDPSDRALPGRSAEGR